jgi:hypothetical protein
LDTLLLKGINEQVFNWICSFLKNRQQFVNIGESSSSSAAVTSGVPQGSVLGPLLFLIYFESISVPAGNFLLKFADDSKIYGVNAEALQTDLNMLVSAIRELGMNIAPQKCVAMNFCVGLPNTIPNFSIEDQPIPSADCEKDIGVFFDGKLKFSNHCQMMVNRAISLNFRILSSFSTREPKFLFSVFKTYVRPLLERDSPAWCPYLKQDILKIEKPQRQFTKRLSGLENMSYLNRLHFLGEDTLYVRRIKFDLILVYKIAHGLIDGLGDLIVCSWSCRQISRA